MLGSVLVRPLTAQERAWYPTADHWITPVLHCWWIDDVPHPTEGRFAGEAFARRVAAHFGVGRR